MEKRVLFLQPDRLVCHSLNKGFNKGLNKGSGRDSFSDRFSVDREWIINGDQLPVELNAYLQNNLHAQFSLVFDLPEEECHQDELKVVGLRDRRYVVERLKKKRFENSLFSTAGIAGSGSQRMLLMSGVDRNSLCEKLMAEFLNVGISLKSIHSSTILTPAIAKKVIEKNNAYLVVIPMHGCFRLVALAGLSVFFTRRISTSKRLDSNSSIDDYRALNQSLEETVLYVQRQQESWKPTIVFVGSAPVAEKLRSLRNSAIRPNQVMEIKSYWPSGDLAATNASVEKILVSAATQASSGYAQKTHRMVYIGRKVRGVCAALLLCSVAAVGTSMAVAAKLNSAQEVVADNYSQSASILQRDIAHLESSYDQPVEAVRQALVAARLLELSSQEPLEFLQTLAPSVRLQPGISISSVRWEAEDIIDETLLVNLQAPPESLESISLEQIYRVTLAGVVKGEPDSALDQFESFVSALREASKDPSIVVMETPFGLGEGRRTTGSDYTAGQGEFVLEISNENVER